MINLLYMFVHILPLYIELTGECNTVKAFLELENALSARATRNKKKI